EIVALGVAGIVGTLTNTVLVVGMLIVLGYVPAAVIIPAVLPQAIVEIVVAVILVVVVVAAWKGIEIRRKGSSV
ncbi:MAG: ECF transporter S component, partial [Chloroflexota bacterium]